MQNVIWK